MPLTLTTPIIHRGLMDGSAGIAVSPDAFITVSDEVNHIMRFSTYPESVGVMALDLNAEKDWFKARPKKKGAFHEADLEGAAQVGQRVYWISSHGYDDEPDETENHRVFFATDLNGEGELVPVGHVYRGLVEDLLAAESLKDFPLEAASQIKPKELGGLNIEALGTAADGETLLIGFRNPIPGGRGLIVPLENPATLVEGVGKASFGKPILLDLGGLGLRDIVWWQGKYLILAGHYKSHLSDESGQPDPAVPATQLYRWCGDAEEKPVKLEVDLDDLNPEALIVFPDDRVLILSDDGGFQKDEFKKDPVNYQGHFRSVWLEGPE